MGWSWDGGFSTAVAAAQQALTASFLYQYIAGGFVSDKMIYLLSHFTLFSISIPVCGSRLSVGRFNAQSPRTRKERAAFVVAELPNMARPRALCVLVNH